MLNPNQDFYGFKFNIIDNLGISISVGKIGICCYLISFYCNMFSSSCPNIPLYLFIFFVLQIQLLIHNFANGCIWLKSYLTLFVVSRKQKNQFRDSGNVAFRSLSPSSISVALTRYSCVLRTACQRPSFKNNFRYLYQQPNHGK